MGDRANFGFRENAEAPIVFLYGHWAGYQMLSRLANAVAVARPRWTDPGYATRICISQIIGEDWNQEYSYGIYVDQIGDNEHSIPVIDWNAQTMSLYEATWSASPDFERAPKFSMGLEAFVSKYSKTPTLV